MGVGLSEDVPAAFQSYWNAEHKKVYGGENGREKLLQASKCLFKRDSLVPKLGAITCPVLVIHGTKDNVFSIPLVKKWTALLQNAKVQTEIIEVSLFASLRSF